MHDILYWRILAIFFIAISSFCQFFQSFQITWYPLKFPKLRYTGFPSLFCNRIEELKHQREEFMRKETIQCFLMDGLFWAIMAIFYGYSTYYLRSIGYSSAQIGIMTAIGSVLSAAIQNVLGTLNDRGGWWNWKRIFRLSSRHSPYRPSLHSVRSFRWCCRWDYSAYAGRNRQTSNRFSKARNRIRSLSWVPFRYCGTGRWQRNNSHRLLWM